jgi:ABC-type glycerol-3-phosphate transport system substrate-binding protein
MRTWAERTGVSLFTVSRAFEALKAEGVIDASHGSGTALLRVPESTGASAAASSAERRQILLWSSGPKDFRRIRLRMAQREFLEAFRDENSAIEVSVEERLQPAHEAIPALIDALLAGNGPTVGSLTQTALDDLVACGCLAPLTTPTSEAFLSEVEPRLLAACTRHGRPYLIPSSVTASCLIYNKQQFAASGLDPDRPPQTWHEFAEFAERISVTNGGAPSFHVQGVSNAVFWVQQLAYQAADATDAADGMPPLEWGSESVGQALTFFLQLLRDSKLMQIHWRPEDTSLFAARCVCGEVPMTIETGVLPAILEAGHGDDFGIAPMPVGPNGLELTLLNVGGWFVNGAAQQGDNNDEQPPHRSTSSTGDRRMPMVMLSGRNTFAATACTCSAVVLLRSSGMANRFS